MYGSLKKWFDGFLTYVMLVFFGSLARLLSPLFFKVEVRGRENIPLDGRRFILCPNHNTYLDPPWVVIFLQPWFYLIRHPGLLPYFLAASDHCFKNAFQGFFYSHLRCIEVKRGEMSKTETIAFFKKISEILAKYNLLVFFEGTRSKTGEIRPAQKGAVKIITDHPECLVIPVRLKGLLEAWPKGAKIPRVSLWKKRIVIITYGEPIGFTDFDGLPKPQRMDRVGERLREAVKAL